MRKHLSIFLLLCIISIFLTACSTEQNNAAEAVLSIYNLYIKEETSDVLKLGITEELALYTLSNHNDSLIQNLQDTINSAGLTVEDATIEEIIVARKSALKTMLATCEITSVKDKTATVKLKTSYFDEATLTKQATEDAIKKAKASDASSEETLLELATKYYTQNLIDSYLAVTPSDEMKELEVNCVLSRNIWVPKDMASFGTELWQCSHSLQGADSPCR